MIPYSTAAFGRCFCGRGSEPLSVIFIFFVLSSTVSIYDSYIYSTGSISEHIDPSVPSVHRYQYTFLHSPSSMYLPVSSLLHNFVIRNSSHSNSRYSLGSSNSLRNNRPNVKYRLQQVCHHLLSTLLPSCFDLLYLNLSFLVGFFLGFFVATCVLYPNYISFPSLPLRLFMGQ